MKILIIVDDFGDGAGNIAHILADQLVSKNHSIGMYLTNYHSKPRYSTEKIDVIDAKWNIMRGNWFRVQKQRVKNIRYLVVEEKFDLIISFLDNNNTIACLAAKKLDIPIIVSERSNPVVIYPKFPWNILRRIAYRRAELVAVQFEAFKCFDHNRFFKKSIVIPNVIMGSKCVKEHLDKEETSFISLGRNHSIKRFPLMIELFADMVQQTPNVSLHIYGAGVKCEDLEGKIKELNLQEKVFLHEAVQNVHETLVKHDVYLMTSEQEGFPNALSEAMACGLPAVAISCHDGIGDLVQNNRNGFCIQEGDKVDFVQSMITLANDAKLRKKFGAESLEIVKAYSEDEVMKIWEKSIEKAIKIRRNTL